MKMLFDFSADGPGSDIEWTAVNDGVMGGVSRGGPAMREKSDTMQFGGVLSLDNNGGFSSVRTDGAKFDLAAFDGVLLRVRGDGRTYQLRFHTNARYWGRQIAYRAEFSTKANEWTEVRIPFAALEPTFRGRDLDGPEFEAGKISALGIMIADKKEGPFALDIDWIKATPANPNS